MPGIFFHAKDCQVRDETSFSNLRPLQWKNNVAKSSGRLDCAVIALV